MFNVAQLKESVAGLLTGVNLNDVTNLDTALSRAARYVAQKIDAPEATGRETITLYGGVYYYNAPPTLFGTAVNLIRPQGNVPAQNLYSYKVPIDSFTRGKFGLPNGYLLDLEYDKGAGIIGISSGVTIPQLIITPMSDSTLFTAGGTAGTISTDTVNYYNPPAALRFTLTGTGTGTITTTLTNSINGSDYQGYGVGFLAIEIPSGYTASNITDITVRLGSSSANYASVSATEGFLGAWVSGQWLLVAYDFAVASNIGTPSWSALAYLQVRITHAGTATNFRLGGFWLSFPSLNEILFQSAAIFKNTAGTLSNTITDDNDEIILNDAAYSILELESAKTIAMQQAGGEYTAQIKGFDAELLGDGGLYQRYAANNPSQQLRTIDAYYDDWPGTSYNTFL